MLAYRVSEIEKILIETILYNSICDFHLLLGSKVFGVSLGEWATKKSAQLTIVLRFQGSRCLLMP